MTMIRKRATSLAALLLCVYSFSVYSFQEMIPAWLRQSVVVALPAILIVVCIAINIIEKPRFLLETVPLCLLCMVGIILFWNNHNIQTEGITSVYSLIVPLLFFFACCRNADWFPTVVKAMAFFGLFYAVCMYICVYIPPVYNQYVAPLMKELYPNANYTQNAVAGFTAHYSTNGMYLSNGFIAFACLAWSKYGNGKRFTLEACLLAFLIIALLICGKRSTLLCLALGTFLTYYLLSPNHKHRCLVIIIASLALLLAIRLVAFILPQVTNAYERTVEMHASGDVTTGRLDLWKMGWDAFLQAPLFGHGWRWFWVDSNTGRDVHNCYLQLFTEVGLVGSVPFFIFLIATYLRALKLAFLWRDGGLGTYHSYMWNNPVPFIMLYQSFFLAYIFVETGLFNIEVLFPYIVSATMTHVLYVRYLPQLTAIGVLRKGVKHVLVG